MAGCLHVEFYGEWVLGRREDEVLPVDALKKTILEKYADCKIVRESLTELVVAPGEDGRLMSPGEVWELMKARYPESTGDDLTITMDDYTGHYHCGDVCLAYMTECNEAGEEDPALTVQNAIAALHGWDEFKKICWEMVDIAPQIRKFHTYDSFLFQNYLFSVNDGWGLTTALRLMASLIDDLSLMSFSGSKTPVELRLVTKSETGKYTPAEAIDLLRGDEEKKRLVCLDVSEFMERSRQDELKRFLLDLVGLQEQYIFAFRIPFVEPEALRTIQEMISDVLFTRVISVPPISDEELWLCAQEQLKVYGFTLSDAARKVFFERISEEKSDGRFYGMQTVKKLVCEILWLKHKADAKLIDDSEGAETPVAVICSSDIGALSANYDETKKKGFDELSEMIGMEEIKERLTEIVSQVKLAMANDNMDKPCLHMRFVGAPGTGKTTVARLVGRIFAEEGILRNGYFFEHTARDLCGEYIGQTAPKTAAICRDAYGSVLFIDEAYALYGGDERGNDYGREALTTLVSEMENHRNDMVVIMAGYKDDMDKLMEGNVGLRSRMPFMLEFKSYTREQLLQIFLHLVKKHFTYEESLEKAAKEYFDNLDQRYMDSLDFSNARFVRNLYERTWSKAAVRMQMSGGSEICLKGEDFNTAAADREFSEKLMIRKSIGF